MSINGEFGAHAHLNDGFRKALWQSRLIGHDGMRDVAAIIAQCVPDDGVEEFNIGERISSVQKAQFYYQSFTGKAFDGLPSSVFQTLMLRNLVLDDRAAKILPENTRVIARQVFDMGLDPIRFRDADVSPLARLAYLSKNLATLEMLHRSLQRGTVAPESMISQKIYQTLVEPIKSLRLHGGDLEDSIFASIREIDFIINNHGEDSCEFINLGRRYPQDIGSPDFLLNFMGLADQPVFAQPFLHTHRVFLDAYRDPHDAFYALWKQTVAPLQSILDSVPQNSFLQRNAARYAMAYAGLRLLEDDDAKQEDIYGKPLATLFQAIDLGVAYDSGYSPELIRQAEAVQASKLLSDLFYLSLTLDPSRRIAPLASSDDMRMLHNQLIQSEFETAPWEKFTAHSEDVREYGQDIYNYMRATNPEFVSYEPYPPQVQGNSRILPSLRLIQP